jgi:ABC-type transport system involved in multi-copper enzyme maturation permease subunit
MHSVILIAGNYVREQRWVVAAWVAMAIGFAGILAGLEGAPSVEDSQLYFSQQGLYAVGLSVFLVASAIHNERKSRRIVAVLSKAVRRSQYIAGLLCGVFLCSAALCLSIALAGSWIAVRAGLPVGRVWGAAGLLLAASLLASTVTMFCSTFSGPLGALIGSGALMGAPVVAAQRLGQEWMQSLPVYWLAASAVTLPVRGAWEVPWTVLALAAVEALAFWMAAALIFSRRDVTAALE